MGSVLAAQTNRYFAAMLNAFPRLFVDKPMRLKHRGLTSLWLTSWIKADVTERYFSYRDARISQAHDGVEGSLFSMSLPLKSEIDI